MADLIKVINRALPPNERYLQYVNTEVANADVIRVYESLGRAADTMTITIVGDGLALKVKINSRVVVAPRRKYPEQEEFMWAEGGYPNLAQATEQLTGAELIDVAARGAGTYVFSSIPIRDVEISKGGGTGTFAIILS
jgi:hypothetical protein